MELAVLVGVVFILGYIIIAFEHKLNLHKSLSAAALGGTVWLLIAIFGDHTALEHSIHEDGAEIFGLILFLLMAMTLVEILIHYRFFDLVRAKLLALKLGDKAQFWVIGTISFFLSAVIDNLTTAIVMIEISRRFFSGKNLAVAAAMIVIAANAGGAWSPIGDITTIMLWLAKKFTAQDIITQGFLPALALFVTAMAMMSRNIAMDTIDAKEEEITISWSEYAVICTALASFLLPLAFSQIGLPPYFGLLFGLGGVGIMISACKLWEDGKTATHLTADIEATMRKVDLASIVFFAGILLSVGALRHLGILSFVSRELFGEAPTILKLVLGNAALGVLSALVDNIPLTAAAIDILVTADARLWVLLAFTVGTGGSMIVIGSAAGVIAMGRVKELTFFNYMRIATFPAAVGYIVGIGVWSAQYMFL